jgi:hypothetical protein
VGPRQPQRRGSVDPPRIERTEIQPLSLAEARIMLDTAKSDRLGPLYSVALAIGLRQGEALGLRWQDVDLEKGTLKVTYQLQRLNGTVKLVEPKINLSRRIETLGESLLEDVERLRRATIELRRSRGPEAEERLRQVLAEPGSEHGQEVLATLRMMAELQTAFGSEACRRYVVSFTRSAADVLAVHELAALAVPDGSLELEVVPLFGPLRGPPPHALGGRPGLVGHCPRCAHATEGVRAIPTMLNAWTHFSLPGRRRLPTS